MSSGQFLRLEYVTPSESQLDNRQGVLGAAAFEGGAHVADSGGGRLPRSRTSIPRC